MRNVALTIPASAGWLVVAGCETPGSRAIRRYISPPRPGNCARTVLGQFRCAGVARPMRSDFHGLQATSGLPGPAGHTRPRFQFDHARTQVFREDTPARHAPRSLNKRMTSPSLIFRCAASSGFILAGARPLSLALRLVTPWSYWLW